MYESARMAVRQSGLDGWLLYDFHGLNPVARRVALLPEGGVFTRRWFLWIPANGDVAWVVSRLEVDQFANMPGRKHVYVGWRELHEQLREVLSGATRVAMEYSPGAAVPTVSLVDAGTIELVRSLGVEVVSSGDLVQAVEAVLDAERIASHRRAAAHLLRIKDEAFDLVARRIASGEPVDEYSIQQEIVSRFEAAGLVTDHPPIVAVNGNASNPHYAPSAERHSTISESDLLLIDMWAREDSPVGVYGDITWMGYVGKSVPERMAQVFDVVRRARDAAIGFADAGLKAGQDVFGYQVDQAARDVIESAGFGEYFFHRTGHNIGHEVHASGVNMDNLETQDRRKLLPGVLFSVEPGIYLPEFGVRSEVDVLAGDRGVEVTTLPLQEEIIPLLR
jgi:Xaa-Pro dipeptidase